MRGRGEYIAYEECGGGEGRILIQVSPMINVSHLHPNMLLLIPFLSPFCITCLFIAEL